MDVIWHGYSWGWFLGEQGGFYTVIGLLTIGPVMLLCVQLFHTRVWVCYTTVSILILKWYTHTHGSAAQWTTTAAARMALAPHRPESSRKTRWRKYGCPAKMASPRSPSFRGGVGRMRSKRALETSRVRRRSTEGRGYPWKPACPRARLISASFTRRSSALVCDAHNSRIATS